MIKKEMIAMLLAGGQGSRLGVLTAKMAKPAVSFGGKYRIIDFPLSNCINSGVDTVGVLTQYRPLRLNSHIGIGIPWDLDRNFGGVVHCFSLLSFPLTSRLQEIARRYLQTMEPASLEPLLACLGWSPGTGSRGKTARQTAGIFDGFEPAAHASRACPRPQYTYLQGTDP